MKYIIAFLLIFLFSLTPAQANRQLVDRIVAVVNDEIITQSELDALLRPIYEQYKQEFRGPSLMQHLNEARQKLLNQLIEDRLVFQEAEVRGITISQSEIDRQANNIKDSYKGEGTLEEAMEAEGMTMSVMEERLRRQAMIRQLHDMEIRSKVVVSPRDIEDYYHENEDKFSAEDSLKIRSVTVKKSEDARRKGTLDEFSKEKIEELRKNILNGEDFGAIAKEHSEDTRAEQEGLSEWIARGTMIPEIDQVIFKLKEGQISQTVETPMGYHVFRVEERRAGYKKTLDEVRDEIHLELFSRKAEKRFAEWMQELKKSAYISVR